MTGEGLRAAVELLRLLGNIYGRTQKEAAAALAPTGVSEAAVRRALRDLLASGLVERYRSGRSYVYCYCGARRRVGTATKMNAGRARVSWRAARLVRERGDRARAWRLGARHLRATDNARGATMLEQAARTYDRLRGGE